MLGSEHVQGLRVAFKKLLCKTPESAYHEEARCKRGWRMKAEEGQPVERREPGENSQRLRAEERSRRRGTSRPVHLIGLLPE